MREFGELVVGGSAVFRVKPDWVFPHLGLFLMVMFGVNMELVHFKKV